MSRLKRSVILFVLVFILPLAVSVVLHQSSGPGAAWRMADRSSAGLLPPAAQVPQAVVRVFAAPTVRWRGAFAVHSWLVLKPAGALSYTRYDVTAWGDPLRINGFEPDGRWFGRAPQVVFAADGDAAEALIPRMRAAIEAYAWQRRGDYRAWPGPNSNTFVAAVLEAVPEAAATLPPNAIGRDYPHDGWWLRRTPGGTGLRLTLGGYAGVTIGTVEGFEVNLFGAVAGFDVMRPALKLPGLGRIGMPSAVSTAAAAP